MSEMARTHECVERCLGKIQWRPRSMMQAHDKVLQQLWEVIHYKDGMPWKRQEEWRDVPQAEV